MKEQEEEFEGLVEVRPPRRQLYVRNQRLGTNEPKLQLLFVHGLLSTEVWWQPVIEKLDVDASCLAYDMLGCGQSSKTEDQWEAYSNKENQQDLLCLIERFTSPELPLVIIGHSYGPSIVLPVLDKIPNLTAFVFLSSAVRTPGLVLPDGGHPLMRLPVPVLQCLQPALSKAFVEAAVHPENVDVRLESERHNKGDNLYIAKAYHRQTKWASVQDLDNCQKIPTLVLHAADDAVIPIQAGQELANSLADSRFVILKRSRHLTMLEEPEVVANEMSTFLRCI